MNGESEFVPVELNVGRISVFNYALYENNVSPIRDIEIINRTGNVLENCSLHITSTVPFIREFRHSIARIPSGKPVTLSDPHLIIDGQMLAEMTEAVTAEILVELCRGEQVLYAVRGQIEVLAYDQWPGDGTYRNLLPAFVMPNHPVIPALMHDAADRLAKWNKSNSIEGYQAHDPNRVRDLTAAAYAAIQKKNIVYAEAPASFSRGQRIRTPETIMEQRFGTCMDMTLLYAALLEQMGLQPLLVLMKGHIFAGVWLKERTNKELNSCDEIIDHSEQLTNRMGNGADELTFVECTAMNSDKRMSFEEAEQAGKKELESDDFLFAIDVYLCRLHGIKPLASRVRENGVYQIEVTEKAEEEITDAPINVGITIADHTEARPRKIANKKELWESKLLDLSLHNMLLNLPVNASVEPIMSSRIDELEDAVSDGHEFTLLSAPEWILDLSIITTTDKKGKKSKSIPWLQEELKKCGVYEITKWPMVESFDIGENLRQEYHNHRLYTFCTPAQLDRELTTIYRAARASQQENGVSSLYLAVGLLRWFPDPESGRPSYAPLMLIPIEIIRKSANQGYALHARDEEPHFNTTLLEMLKQNYNIEIPGLDPLPTDEHGTNIKKVFSLVRSALYTLRNWDVVESCVIGNFSFAQFAMWNDIHTAGEMLDHSKIVRSLMKGHVDWEVENKAATESGLESEKVYLPITVDATQLKAIQMAAHGTTFVLHGPPGTGKSQTITGMIANLMAQGKSVLFVAEKMAALSVVQKRLASLGIGDFCLELHSDKANKKQVLTQLNKALSVQHPLRKTEYGEYRAQTDLSRKEIDGYAEHLHRTQNCGYSLRELIALYETVRDEEKSIVFDWDKAGQLTKSDMKAQLPLIDRLTAAGGVVTGGIAGNPLIGVGLTSYSAEVRGQLRQSAQHYADELSAVQEAGKQAAAVFAMHAPENMQDIHALESLVALYADCRNENPMAQKLLVNPTEKVALYYDRMDEADADKERLLEDWQEEFLQLDMEEFLARHTAAGRKFLGKSSAMAQITAEIQAYARKTINYEVIPLMLRRVANYQQKERDLEQRYEAMPEDLQLLIRTYVTKDEYEQAYAGAKAAKAQAEKFPGGMEAIRKLAADPANDRLFADLTASAGQLETAEKEFNALLHRTVNAATENWFGQEMDFCHYVMEHPAALKDWGMYNQVRQECVKVGLKPVVEAYEQGMNADQLTGAYRKGLYYALISSIIAQDDVLSCFSGATFNESIAQFKKLDDLLLEQTRKEIYYLLSSRVPTSWTDAKTGLEMTILRKAIGSNARGVSIRELFERISHILPRLTPCMLMSPNSVAQYLAQKNDLFDVVIFDEASQLPTCKAVGALARAKDAVIVGDPKQMPPTSFFSGAGPEVDDLALDDLDSILDDALALGVPSQHLQWHYRSTHESLIAFSNNEFYENKMYTFPSANDRERHVTAVHVNGLYSKSTNIKEAEAVVEEIVRRFHDPALRNESIGVVTFNVKQQALIENLLGKQFQSNAELDAWANGGEDPVFVKNLENVQGDERDVILFSIGYGPDEKGRVSNNFGPINKQGGGKRLNVAFSRARVTMTIFSSIYSSDIKITENSPEGLVAFRDFLKFAEGHDFQTAANAETREKLTRAGILQNICKAIENHGYQCATMVGHSDFHVDIAVVDPTDPDQYLMGILLDGDGYRQTKNTRDREVAQIGVLKHLGWKLCRVWTMDWWDNRDREIQKLLAKLDQLKAEAESSLAGKKAEEEKRQEELAQHREEEEKLKEELKAQAAEVLAEDEAAANEQKERKTLVSPMETEVELTPEPAEEVENAAEQLIPEEEAVPVEGTAPAEEKASTEETIPAEGMASEEELSEEPREERSKDELEEGPRQKEIKEESAEETNEELTAAAGDSASHDEIGELVQQLIAMHAQIVDKRANGGALWLVGGKELEPIVTGFVRQGIHFIYKQGGGRATGGNDGWWAKTDVVLPETAAQPSSDAAPVNQTERAAAPIGEMEPIPYVKANIEMTPISSAEFAKPENKAAIAARIRCVVEAEAPILKEEVFRRVFASYNIAKGKATEEAYEKAFKAAKVKVTRIKGMPFCWSDAQDPKTWRGIRVSNERSGDEICVQEIGNAICYVLRQKGSLEKDELIKETSLLFGYKRLGKNLEAALTVGLQYARSAKMIRAAGSNRFELAENDGIGENQ